MLSVISDVIAIACFPVTVYLAVRAYLTAKEAERVGEKARYRREEAARLLEKQSEVHPRPMDRESGVKLPRFTQ